MAEKTAEQIAAEKDAAAKNTKATITHPFKELKVGSLYNYHRKTPHWPRLPKKDDKGEAVKDKDGNTVLTDQPVIHKCKITTTPRVDKDSKKIVDVTVVDFDNTGRDTVHDVSTIPTDAVFTEV